MFLLLTIAKNSEHEEDLNYRENNEANKGMGPLS